MRALAYRDERLVLADAEKAEMIDRRDANANRRRQRLLRLLHLPRSLLYLLRRARGLPLRA